MATMCFLQITKFVRPKDIPKHFITNRIAQFGKIKAIEPNLKAGAVLQIDHKPPLNLFFASQKTLPVKVSTDLFQLHPWVSMLMSQRKVF